jgi:hypothetical protein
MHYIDIKLYTSSFRNHFKNNLKKVEHSASIYHRTTFQGVRMTYVVFMPLLRISHISKTDIIDVRKLGYAWSGLR